MNAEIDAALGIKLSGDATNEEAAKESAADENDEDLEAKAGEDSPQDDFTQPDGFTDLTSGTFMEGQEDFSVDF